LTYFTFFSISPFFPFCLFPICLFPNSPFPILPYSHLTFSHFALFRFHLFPILPNTPEKSIYFACNGLMKLNLVVIIRNNTVDF
jgi:hypothetical protein